MMAASAHAGVQPAGTRQARRTVDAGRFGPLLRQARLRAGLSQEALAERARLSCRTISDLERGVKQTPHFETVALLAEALRLPEAEQAAFVAAARPERAPQGAVPGPARRVPAGGADRPAAFSPRAAVQRPGPPLRAPLTLLIGREREAAAVLHLL